MDKTGECVCLSTQIFRDKFKSGHRFDKFYKIGEVFYYTEVKIGSIYTYAVWKDNMMIRLSHSEYLSYFKNIDYIRDEKIDIIING